VRGGGHDRGRHNPGPRLPLCDILTIGMMRAVTIRVRSRGTVRLPAAVWAKYGLDERDPLSLVDLDGAMLFCPRSLVPTETEAVADRLRGAASGRLTGPYRAWIILSVPASDRVIRLDGP
jgi:hypothetical protein